MKDRFGRDIDYMRVSVTDRCNYRCVYCMPPEGVPQVSMAELLTYEETEQICRVAAELGITRIKITGGEPLVRRGVPALIGMLHKIPGIEQVTLTTNGALLERHLDDLLAAGLDAVNISLDTLDPARFSEITRGGDLRDVWNGLQAALGAGLPVKLNTVLYAGEDWKTMAEAAGRLHVDVRFIEMMPIGKGSGYAGASREDVLRFLTKTYGTPEPDDRRHGNGPAVYYRFPGLSGSVGLIAPIHGMFCGTCNRIRLSASGQIKPCLCYGETVDLRGSLRSGDMAGVRRKLEEAIRRKPRAHGFADEGGVTETGTMNRIGG